MTKSQAGKLGAERARSFHSARKANNEIAYLTSPKKCKQCSAVLPYAQRVNNFCSSSCSALFNNTLRQKKTIPCLSCSTPLPSKGRRSQRRFCNAVCQSQFRWAETKANIVNNYLDDVSDASIKRYLIELNGQTCSTCKLTTWNGQPIPVELDHIDGHPDTNRGLNNCRLLCPNCHALTPTYGIKNKGNGRWLRRQRYAQGLST